MSDAEIELKREEDERLDTAEDPNEEVRPSHLSCARAKPPQTRCLYIALATHIAVITYHKEWQLIAV